MVLFCAVQASSKVELCARKKSAAGWGERAQLAHSIRPALSEGSKMAGRRVKAVGLAEFHCRININLCREIGRSRLPATTPFWKSVSGPHGVWGVGGERIPINTCLTNAPTVARFRGRGAKMAPVFLRLCQNNQGFQTESLFCSLKSLSSTTCSMVSSSWLRIR
jgi:hypothetical protein